LPAAGADRRARCRGGRAHRPLRAARPADVPDPRPPDQDPGARGARGVRAGPGPRGRGRAVGRGPRDPAGARLHRGLPRDAPRRAVPDPAEAARAYRALAADLAGAGMPGVEAGLVPLALVALHLRRRQPVPTAPDLDPGPHRAWVEPLLRHARGEVDAARRAAAALPEPPADHLYDALWAVVAHTAVRLGDRSLAAGARAALAPLRGELAGGATAALTFGPVDDLLAMLDDVGPR